MNILTRIADAFRPFSHEREAQKKLTEARLLLVEHECQREYFDASATMLKARIARLELSLRLHDESTDSLSARTAGQTKPVDWEERNGMHAVARATKRTSAAA